MRSQIAALPLAMLVALLHPGVAGTQTLSGLTGDAVLSVSNGLTQTAAGAAVAPLPLMLLKESFEDTLQKKGTSLASWVNACRMLQPRCKEDLYALEPVVVDAKIAMPNDGRATFGGVPPGSYYVFGQAMYGNQLLVWDVKIDLRSGANVVTLDQGNVAPIDSAQPRAQAPAGGSPAAAAAAAGQRTVDPGIATARAAKIDTMVFGISMGEPLKLPVCEPRAPLALVPPPVTAVCVSNTDDLQTVNELLGLAAPLLGGLKLESDPNLVLIMLPDASCPAWLNGCSITGRLHEGLLVTVELTTRGRAVEQAVAKELRGKYGQGVVLATEGTITPPTGNPFKVTDLLWALPGFHVEYLVVLHTETEVSDITRGLVRIETETGYKLRRAKEEEAAKPKL